MRPLDIVFYHSPCTDGFTGAWAIWKAYGDAVQYIPLRYGDKLPVDVTAKHVLFVDVSLKREETIDAALVAASVVILDHHKSAEVELVDLYCEDYDLGTKLDVVFEMKKSGARLAWEWAHGKQDDPPFLVQLVEDRDLWLFRFVHTKVLTRYINSFPMDFRSWDKVYRELEGDAEAPRDIGEALERAFMIEVERLADLAYVARTEDGLEFPAAHATKIYSSDLAHELLKRNPEAPFAAVKCFENGQEIWSLRSEDHRQDVRAIAEWMGGGGHRNAAGFQMGSYGHEDAPFSMEDIVAGEERAGRKIEASVAAAARSPNTILQDLPFVENYDETLSYKSETSLPKAE